MLFGLFIFAIQLSLFPYFYLFNSCANSHVMFSLLLCCCCCLCCRLLWSLARERCILCCSNQLYSILINCIRIACLSVFSIHRHRSCKSIYRNKSHFSQKLFSSTGRIIAYKNKIAIFSRESVDLNSNVNFTLLWIALRSVRCALCYWRTEIVEI